MTTQDAPLDVRKMAEAMHAAGICENWSPGYGRLDENGEYQDHHGAAEHHHEARRVVAALAPSLDTPARRSLSEIVVDEINSERDPAVQRLVEAARELRDAEDAYWSNVERGPVRPPDEPDFAPWRRRKAAQSGFREALRHLEQEAGG